MTIQELAAKYSSMFEVKERANGDKFHCVKDEYSNKPDYQESSLYQLIKDAHSDMFPDDYKYQFIVEALDNIAECDDEDEIDCLSMEPNCYNSELLKWVASHSYRVAYCDDVLAEYGHGIGLELMGILQHGQQRESEEVLHSVVESLRTIIENGEAN